MNFDILCKSMGNDELVSLNRAIVREQDRRFNPDKFPELTEEEEKAIDDGDWVKVIRSYRDDCVNSGHSVSLPDAKRVVEHYKKLRKPGGASKRRVEIG